MRRTIFIFILFLIVARPAASQTILPPTFANWSTAEPSVVIPSTGLDQTLGQDAAVFREYYLKSLERRTYAHGAQTAAITLYRFRDPSSAYGAYTFLRKDSLIPFELGSFAAASGDRVLMVVGDL